MSLRISNRVFSKDPVTCPVKTDKNLLIITDDCFKWKVTIVELRNLQMENYSWIYDIKPPSE
jgi:hypothetical protein